MSRSFEVIQRGVYNSNRPSCHWRRVQACRPFFRPTSFSRPNFLLEFLLSPGERSVCPVSLNTFSLWESNAGIIFCGIWPLFHRVPPSPPTPKNKRLCLVLSVNMKWQLSDFRTFFQLVTQRSLSDGLWYRDLPDGVRANSVPKRFFRGRSHRIRTGQKQSLLVSSIRANQVS